MDSWNVCVGRAGLGWSRALEEPWHAACSLAQSSAPRSSTTSAVAYVPMMRRASKAAAPNTGTAW